MQGLDAIDRRIIEQLRKNARISNAHLASAVGLSQSACLRRVKLLEKSGTIRGYTVLLDRGRALRGIVVFVQISLERQSDDWLSSFEKAARGHAEIRECYLMSGSSDYQLQVIVDDFADYERVHRDVLSALPGVARVQSSFSIRAIIRTSG